MKLVGHKRMETTQKDLGTRNDQGVHIALRWERLCIMVRYGEIMILEIFMAKEELFTTIYPHLSPSIHIYPDLSPSIPIYHILSHPKIELRHQPIAAVCRYCSAELYPLPGLCENQLAGE